MYLISKCVCCAYLTKTTIYIPFYIPVLFDLINYLLSLPWSELGAGGLFLELLSLAGLSSHQSMAVEGENSEKEISFIAVPLFMFLSTVTLKVSWIFQQMMELRNAAAGTGGFFFTLLMSWSRRMFVRKWPCRHWKPPPSPLTAEVNSQDELTLHLEQGIFIPPKNTGISQHLVLSPVAYLWLLNNLNWIWLPWRSMLQCDIVKIINISLAWVFLPRKQEQLSFLQGQQNDCISFLELFNFDTGRQRLAFFSPWLDLFFVK